MEDEVEKQPSPSSDSETSTRAAEPRKRRKVKKKYRKRTPPPDPSIYDLVAGRVEKAPAGQKLHRGSRMKLPVTAEQFYFENKHISEEDDERIEWLPEITEYLDILPPSDLLWAVHRYASGFFHEGGRKKYLKYMDGTALLAMGILLDETIKEKVGERGYLAFLEMAEAHRPTGIRGGGDEDEDGDDESGEKSDGNAESDSELASGSRASSQDDFLTREEDDANAEPSSRAEQVLEKETDDHQVGISDSDSMEL